VRLPIRWRLILVAWSLASATAVVLTLLSYSHTRRELLEQLESTLETKCDEVITVLNSSPLAMLERFLLIETRYRFSPYEYFYQVSDEGGRLLVRSSNLNGASLPLPERNAALLEGRHHVRTAPHPLSPETDRVRVRTERVAVRIAGTQARTVVIQTAVSLEPFEAALSKTQRTTYLVAGVGLAAVFFLLWFVTTRALQPVAAMTAKASEITVANLEERLPLAGRGDELDRLAGVINLMLDRLAGSMRQMEEFSADAAHQLRTPLTRIRGELDLALRSDPPEPLRADLERIQEEMERLARLCGRLLLFARLDRKDPEFRAAFGEVVPLEPLVAELVDQLTPAATERGVSLSAAAAAAPRVRGSRPLLVEALLNLLDNAIRASPSGGKIGLSIDRRGGFALISVADEGPGVPPEERERIFQPFHRLALDGASPLDDGAGLGLSLATAIARAHGGGVELECPVNGGSVFRLVLPVLG